MMPRGQHLSSRLFLTPKVMIQKQDTRLSLVFSVAFATRVTRASSVVMIVFMFKTDVCLWFNSFTWRGKCFYVIAKPLERVEQTRFAK